MKRIPLLLFGTFIIAVVLLGELYYIQIMRGEEYRDRAAGQYHALAGLFDRRDIYFTEKGDKGGPGVAVATLKNGYILAINPAQMTDLSFAYEKLSHIVPLDEQDFLEKARKTKDPYEEVARRVGEEEKDKIAALALPGVGLYHERWRHYPMGNEGSHTIGFVGYGDDGTSITGQYGVERYYNDILDKNSGETKQNLFVEIFSGLSEIARGEQAIHGDVMLTIEPTVNRYLFQTLQDIQVKWNSKLTGGIIMDPKTGAIYALGASPDFDPNNISAEKNLAVFNNPLIENVFEMGSVVKPLAMAAALDAGNITSKTTYDDPTGSVVIEGARISNFDGKARGNDIPMQEVLSQSLNTGMVFVMKKMGRELFSKYMLAYGLGEETGIDLPGETYGLVENLRSPRDIEHATAAFGQGIAITPLALSRALASLGNGGILPDPHLLKEIRYGAGLSKGYVQNGEPKRVLKASTSEEITRMLVTLVDEALLGGTVKLPHYSIAAKTGTAQISRGSGSGYYDDRYLHSFFGYFPAYDPKFIVFLFTVEPVGERYASHTLTEPFMNIAKFLLAYYEVPPDR